MPVEPKKNLFGHSSVAKPLVSNERMTQMTDLLRDNPEAEIEVPEGPGNMPLADLEQLVFLGCIEDSKTISGYKFDMRTLTGKEQNDVWVSVSYLGNDTKFFVIKVSFLSRAILAVNGRGLDILYKGKDYREITKEQRCVRVVETWQQPLIDELYEFYSELLERSRKVISPEQLKK